MQRYRRPPITEAVIEVRFRLPVEADILGRMEKKLSEAYPLPPQRMTNINVEITEKGARLHQEVEGYRLTSVDGSGIVNVSPVAIGTSRLAPYQGWEPFFAQARQNWEIWKKFAGWREIARVGVRYINRIDIPTAGGNPISVGDYLLVTPQVPDIGSAPLADFTVSVVTPYLEDKLTLRLSASSAPPALVDSTSIVLDLDFACDKDLPQNDEGLWTLIGSIRQHKNDVFEACITERTRGLFGN